MVDEIEQNGSESDSNEQNVVLGIHTKYDPEDSTNESSNTSGHAFISITYPDGTTETYGGWPDEHPNVAILDPDPEHERSDFRKNFEGDEYLFDNMNSYESKGIGESRYYDLDEDQLSDLKEFISKDHDWGYTNNCSGIAAGAVEAATGEDLSSWPYTTPTSLAGEIQDKENGHSTNVVTPQKTERLNEELEGSSSSSFSSSVDMSELQSYVKEEQEAYKEPSHEIG